MLKCPFCHYENEDGALFCEQCKSDLAGVEPAGVPAPAEATAAASVVAFAAVAEAMPIGQAIMMEAVAVEAMPIAEATPIIPETHAPSMPAAEPLTPAQAPMAEAAPMALSPAAPAAPEEAIAAATVGSTAAETMAGSTPAAPSAPPAAGSALPPGAQPRLRVLRGLKRDVEYPIYEGHNFIGRADEKPVDIDLEDQEPPDRIWSSRQHAVITLENDILQIEDLNSSNGTFVNRARIHPGQPRPLAVNDVVQIGTVQLKVLI